MPTEIKMPQLSDTMYSGKILVWHKQEGQQVSRGEILAEVETDKANLEIENFTAGVLLKIQTPAGATANVGDVIAIIGQAGESISTPNTTSTTASPVVATPQPNVVQTTVSAPSLSAHDRIKASPLAKKVAEQKNIDLRGVAGSGPHGRILVKDVEMRSGPNLAVVKQPESRVHPITSNEPGASKPLSKMREAIARRMQESVRDNPHFYSTISVNVEEVTKLREFLKTDTDYKGVSINHFIIKAVARALHLEPRVNNAMRDGKVYEPPSINIGIITALEDGLLIPVIHAADKLSLRDVVFESKAAIERARAGRPLAHDLSGGTFSISNMGMFDVENFTAVINPGQGAILAVSAAKELPIVRAGQIVIGLEMKVTLSVDHRIIDGVMAVTFLKHFKEGLEHPAVLMA